MLVAGARKELAYLDQFGSRRAPYKGLQRYCYHNEKQELSDRAKKLDRYLLPAPSLVPDNDFLMTLCLCHPDFNQHQQFQNFEEIPVAYYGFTAYWTGNTLLSYPSSSTPVCPTASRTKRTCYAMSSRVRAGRDRCSRKRLGNDIPVIDYSRVPT